MGKQSSRSPMFEVASEAVTPSSGDAADDGARPRDGVEEKKTEELGEGEEGTEKKVVGEREKEGEGEGEENEENEAPAPSDPGSNEAR